MSAINIYYIVVVWFLFITLTCGKKYPSSAILFIAALVNIIAIDFLGFVDGMSYLDSKYMLVKYDGALGLIMVMMMSIDKVAKQHAKILAFAVMCHSMISLHLMTNSSGLEGLSFLFYQYYDELIIMTALLQMWVSRDGMAIGLNNTFYRIQGCLFWLDFYSGHNFKRLLTRKERES